MSKIIVKVEFTLRDGIRDEFLEVIRGHAAGTKADEAVCTRCLDPGRGREQGYAGGDVQGRRGPRYPYRLAAPAGHPCRLW